jgi:hypothetical protein
MGAASATMTVGALSTPRIVSRRGPGAGHDPDRGALDPVLPVHGADGVVPRRGRAYVLRSALMNLSQPLWRNLMMDITPPSGGRR